MTVAAPPIWTMLKGAAKYAAAVASGDIATPSDQADRAATCANCSALARNSALGHYVYTCGVVGHDRRSDPMFPTCGCIVLTAPRNQTDFTAAGKAVVASESCPQGKWSAATIHEQE